MDVKSGEVVNLDSFKTEDEAALLARIDELTASLDDVTLDCSRLQQARFTGVMVHRGFAQHKGWVLIKGVDQGCAIKPASQHFTWFCV